MTHAISLNHHLKTLPTQNVTTHEMSNGPVNTRVVLKIHGLPTFSKYRIDEETSPEALIIQTTNPRHAMWTEVV